MADIALLLLKFTALVVGGIFAVIGLLTKYHDRNGKVTRWGKIALFGIVLSTTIGAGAQAIESYSQYQKRLANDAANRKAEEQTQKLLGQIKRAVYPIRNVTLKNFQILYPIDQPPISNFSKNFPRLRWKNSAKSASNAAARIIQCHLLIPGHFSNRCWMFDYG
jgi:hypothetical protein